MKAWILHNPNNMTYEETEKPQPKSDEVLVAVKAAGICGSDIPRAFVTGAHVHPIIIGHEFSGQVCACGTDVDAKWQGIHTHTLHTLCESQHLQPMQVM